MDSLSCFVIFHISKELHKMSPACSGLQKKEVISGERLEMGSTSTDCFLIADNSEEEEGNGFKHSKGHSSKAGVKPQKNGLDSSTNYVLVFASHSLLNFISLRYPCLSQLSSPVIPISLHFICSWQPHLGQVIYLQIPNSFILWCHLVRNS